MCGFGGIINFSESVTRDKLYSIAKKVDFRGPDSTEVCLYNNAWERVTGNAASSGLFFNRLAIIDLDERSNQPFENDDYVLLFNGEIYNYASLKVALQKEGVVFKTTSDTEVLFHALIKWGKAALKELNGMFAFFFLDKKKQQVLLAKDRTGIKQLYYKHQQGKFIFASDLMSVARMAPEHLRISKEAVNLYLALQYIPTPLSILEDVYKLPPGYYIESSLEDLKKSRKPEPRVYWDSYDVAANSSEKDFSMDELIGSLTNSVKLHLQADVPVGLFLSSGIDSSLLASVLSQDTFLNGDYNFFTVAFTENTSSDESNSAAAFLKGFRSRNFHHHKLIIDTDSIRTAFDDVFSFTDEPFGDSAHVLNYVISREAGKHATVVLSGDGGDDLFWGYSRYRAWQQAMKQGEKNVLLGKLRRVVQPFVSARVDLALSRKMETDPLKLYQYFIKSTYWGRNFSFENHEQLWINQRMNEIHYHEQLPSLVDMKSYLPDCMNYKVDRASMGASIEVRVPFLENNIIDQALRLPLAAKSDAEYATKAPLKAALKKLAPHYQQFDVKKGFSFPLEQWMTTVWKDEIMAMLNDETRFDELGVNWEFATKLTRDFFAGKNKALFDVWYLFNLIKWYDHFKKEMSIS